MVHHPRERQGLHREKEGSRLSRRDEPGDGARGCADARARSGRRLRRAAQAERAADRPRLLPRPVRQADAADHARRQAAPARAQHGLRRRAVAAAVDRHGADGEGAQEAAREETEGDRAEHAAPQGRLRLRRGHLHQAGSLRRRADEQDAGHDPHRGQCRRGHRLHDGWRHRRRLVPDHAVVVASGSADRLPEEVPPRSGERQDDIRGRAGGRRARRPGHGDRRRDGRARAP